MFPVVALTYLGSPLLAHQFSLPLSSVLPFVALTSCPWPRRVFLCLLACPFLPSPYPACARLDLRLATLACNTTTQSEYL